MKLRVRVPATTANLGPGFDCLGLALDWWNTITVEPIERGLEVECLCEAAELPCDDRNLVVRAMRAVFRRVHRTVPPLHLEIDCDVPVGRGLGSSASAIVGGVVAANAWLGNPFSRDELLKLASDMEGHPDNVAPALLGGFVISLREGKELTTVRISVPQDLKCILFVPDNGLSTHHARQVLPRRVLREDAVYNIGRTALWVAALQTRHWEWLDLATGDRLHQPYRAHLVPGMQPLFETARRAGAHGVALSGAGPSVIAFADCRAEEIGSAMERTAARIHLAGKTKIVRASSRGVQVTKST